MLRVIVVVINCFYFILNIYYDKEFCINNDKDIVIGKYLKFIFIYYKNY